MNGLNTVLVLATAYLGVFLQSTVTGFRNLVGAQPDILPSLVVYASLTSGLGLGTLTAVCGGLWIDSLSFNPPGISILPLFLISLVIERYRGLILRDQTYAQFITGLGASAAAPLLTVLLLLNLSSNPLIGWGSLWQWVVMTLVGGALTPGWFVFFGALLRRLSYQTLPDPTARSNREIKRGR
jgi:rod shape-determining protein MreD